MKQVVLQATAALTVLMWAVALFVGLWIGVYLAQRSQRQRVLDRVDAVSTEVFQVTMMAPVTVAETNAARIWARGNK